MRNNSRTKKTSVSLSEVIQKTKTELNSELENDYARYLGQSLEKRLKFVRISEESWEKEKGSIVDKLKQQKDISIGYFAITQAESNTDTKEFVTAFKHALNKIAKSLPERINRPLTHEEIQHCKDDHPPENRAKAKKRLKARLGIQPRTRVSMREIGLFHLKHGGYRLLSTVIKKVDEMEVTFIEAWLQVIADIAEKDKNSQKAFNALKTLVKEQNDYLKSYLLKSGNFLVSEIELDAHKIAQSQIKEDYRKKMSEIASIEAVQKARMNVLNSEYRFGKHLLQLELLCLRGELKFIMDGTRLFIEKQLFSRAKKEVKRIEKWVTALDARRNQAYEGELVTVSDQFPLDELMLTDFFQNIAQLTAAMPSKNVLYTSNLQEISIDTAFLCDYVLDEAIQNPLQAALFELPGRCSSALSSMASSVTLLGFVLTAEREEPTPEEDVKDAFARANNQIEKTGKELEDISKRFNEKLDDLLTQVGERLNADALIGESEQLSLAAERKQRKTVFSTLLQKLSRPFRLRGSKYSRILSSTRDEIIYAEFLAKNKLNESAHAVLRSFVESISPSSKALDQLPFYYQQLFVGKHAPKENLFHHRERELKQADKAIERILKGSGGMITILGDPLSGRTFFCDMLCLKLQGRNIYRIDAPISGSKRPEQFFKALEKQLHLTVESTDALSQIPEGSVFIFNDMELWWERHTSGWETLKILMKMVKQWSNRFIFIANTTPYAYRIMRLYLQLDDQVISTIPLSPFPLKSMQNALLQRHRTGGLLCVLDGKHEKNFTRKQWQRVVKDLSDLSDGNVGAVFHLWLGLMTECDGETIRLHSSTYRELPEITNRDQLVVIAQFILHKHMTVNKLSRILVCSTQKAQDYLTSLKRSGLIIEVIGETYRISPYTIPFVIQRLKSLKLI